MAKKDRLVKKFTRKRTFKKKQPTTNSDHNSQTDTRFVRAAYDPRFRDEEDQTSGINLQDDRFNKIFDKAFTDDYAVDEYGRRITRNSADFLAKYYKLSGREIKDKLRKREEDLQEYGSGLDGEVEVKEDEADEEEEEEEEEVDEEESELDEDDEEEESSDEGEDIEEAMKRFLEHADEEEEVTTRDDDEAVASRLAIQNMDWGGLTSVDLLAILQHFAPPGGVVKKVAIYPSELGKRAMAIEAVSGPEGIWKDTREEGVKKAYEGFDEHGLRRYERNVLRYYYAIAECDSKKTAAHIYDTCDGMEFEDSVNTLDLRFVPEDQTFTNEPRDEATKVPDNYVAPAIFTKALGHSQQELSWDRADPKRSALLLTDFSRKQLKDISYETFVNVINDDDDDEDDNKDGENGENDAEEAGAGESSNNDEEGSEGLEEEEQAEDGDQKQNGKKSNNTEKGNGTVKKKNKEPVVKSNGKEKVTAIEDKKQMKKERTRSKYMSLLSGMYNKQQQKEELQISFDSNFENLAAVSDDEDQNMEREATFIPGLDEKAKEIMKEKERKALPAWEQYLQKRAEKQKLVRDAKKDKAKSAMEERKQALKDANKKKKSGETEEEIRSKTELELLVAGDKDIETGFNMRQLTEEEKNKNKKEKKKKEKEEKRQQAFTMNVDDPRFSAIFTNKEYAIDRSNPDYKPTATMKILEKEAITRRYDATGAPRQLKSSKAEITQANEPSWDSSRVASLKRKVETMNSTKQKQVKL